MLNNKQFYVSATLFLMIFFGAISSSCGLYRWLQLEPGIYRPLPNAAAGSIDSVEVNRDNQLATFHLTDGSRTVVSFSSRDRLDWPTGCPANIGSTYMEVLDIADRVLTIAEFTFEDPILMRGCPSDPERIALREDGFLDSGGSACAGLEKCLYFSSKPDVTPVQTAPILNVKPLPLSMKGYEFYSWTDEEDGLWHYTLITGTNRLKTIEEITAEEDQVTQSEWVKITVTGTEDLKALLKRLPPDTYLSWREGNWLEGRRDAAINVRLPKPGLVEAIQNHCRQLKLQLHVNQ